MTDRIAKLTRLTLQGDMYVAPVKTEFDREDLLLSQSEMDVKRICEYILNQEPKLTEYSSMTGFFNFDGSVVGDAFRRSGHKGFSEAKKLLYTKPIGNLSVFEWQHATADYAKILNKGIRGIIDDIEIGSIKGLKQIHSQLFGGIYEFAGQLRKLNISKGGFTFASVGYLEQTLSAIEKMEETSVEGIVKKYVEMNVAHPFMEGNGRSTRIWLDQIMKKNLKKCVDWSKIDKTSYLNAMKKSVVDYSEVLALIERALTDKINDREIFMKGIDYSYYYEEE